MKIIGSATSASMPKGSKMKMKKLRILQYARCASWWSTLAATGESFTSKTLRTKARGTAKGASI